MTYHLSQSLWLKGQLKLISAPNVALTGQGGMFHKPTSPVERLLSLAQVSPAASPGPGMPGTSLGFRASRNQFMHLRSELQELSRPHASICLIDSIVR